VRVKHRPRLLSDNGPTYVSGELREYLKKRKWDHTRSRPYHPQTQGKIERWHRTTKNVVKLQHYYFPWELEAALRDFVGYLAQATSYKGMMFSDVPNLATSMGYTNASWTLKCDRRSEHGERGVD
jgi:putative transposase